MYIESNEGKFRYASWYAKGSNPRVSGGVVRKLEIGGRQANGVRTELFFTPGGARTHYGFDSLLGPSFFNVRIERN